MQKPFQQFLTTKPNFSWNFSGGQFFVKIWLSLISGLAVTFFRLNFGGEYNIGVYG